MKALVFPGDRRVKVIDTEIPEPGTGEVLIQIKASGLCGSSSDLRPYRLPQEQLSPHQQALVRGHEPCGVVVRVGQGVRYTKVGDRVMIHHYRGCGLCRFCLSGWPQMCSEGFDGYGLTIPGGHAEYMVCVDTACIHMPDELLFEEGACVSCGGGTAYQALKRLDLSGLSTLAIFGQGFVGLFATMLASTAGVRVIAVDIADEQIAMASRFGAWKALNSKKDDPTRFILEATSGQGVDASMDCSGAESAQIAMIAATKKWGRVCFVGVGASPKLDILQITRKQLSLSGSWTFGTNELSELGNLVVNRGLPLDRLIIHRFPFAEAEKAYQILDAGVTGKIVLLF